MHCRENTVNSKLKCWVTNIKDLSNKCKTLEASKPQDPKWIVIDNR